MQPYFLRLSSELLSWLAYFHRFIPILSDHRFMFYCCFYFFVLIWIIDASEHETYSVNYFVLFGPNIT